MHALLRLDSAVALHYFKILRELCRATGMTNIVSTYQTSQAEFDLCDRVIIIYEGCVHLLSRDVVLEDLKQIWLTTSTPFMRQGCKFFPV